MGMSRQKDGDLTYLVLGYLAVSVFIFIGHCMVLLVGALLRDTVGGAPAPREYWRVSWVYRIPLALAVAYLMAGKAYARHSHRLPPRVRDHVDRAPIAHDRLGGMIRSLPAPSAVYRHSVSGAA